MSDNTDATTTNSNSDNTSPIVVPKDDAPIPEPISTNSSSTTTTTATPKKKDDENVSPETKKIIEQSQLIQAEIQGTQLQSIKAVYDLIKGLDEKKVKAIEKQFAEGVIQLEEIDEDGNVKPFTKPYTSLTTRGEEAVNKVIREVRAFKADITSKLPLEDLQKRYPELMDGVYSLEEIAPDKVKVQKKDENGNTINDKNGNPILVTEDRDSESFLQLIDNYIVKKKAKIYFKIDDIGNFPKKDLRNLIYLYQYRNTYNPYYVNPT
jgi:hypothetical protein